MSLNLRPVWARIVRPTLLWTGLVLSLAAVSLPVAAESEFRAGDPPYLERDEVQASSTNRWRPAATARRWRRCLPPPTPSSASST